MMMNFKKNQNNAVCSMDCKNCPNGASQPNPMDDSMFEKSIAMLQNPLSVGSCGGFGNRPERQRMQHQSVYAGTHHRLCEREPDGGFHWRRVGSGTAPDLRRCL